MSGPRSIPPDREAEFVALWQSGEPRASIAKRLGVSDQTVGRYRSRLDLPPRSGGRPTAILSNPERSEEFRRLWQDRDNTVAAIASHFGVSVQTVLATRKRLKLPSRREFTDWTAKEDATLRRLYPSGAAVEGIAAKVGRTVEGVKGRVERLNLSRSPEALARSRAASVKPAVDWTPDNIRTLVSLWDQGIPARLIADAIPGATKNAIIGKARRLQLGEHPGGGSGGRPRKKPEAQSEREFLALVVEALKAGEKLWTISRRTGLSFKDLRRIGRDAGIAMRRPALTKRERADIARRFAAGEPRERIAERFDLDPRHVSQIALAEGASPRQARDVMAMTDTQRDVAVDLFARYVPVAEIAARIGIPSAPALEHWFWRQGHKRDRYVVRMFPSAPETIQRIAIEQGADAFRAALAAHRQAIAAQRATIRSAAAMEAAEDKANTLEAAGELDGLSIEERIVALRERAGMTFAAIARRVERTKSSVRRTYLRRTKAAGDV